MGFVELVLLGVSLAMDAFAVSVCKGLGMKKVNYVHAFVIALFFGGFQALMPAIGWFLGAQLQSFIEPVDHWVAFILLAFIGGKMLWDGIRGDGEEEESCETCKDSEKLDIPELFMLAIATSIDALAVGITFAFLKVNVVVAVTIIGVVTAIISFAGVAIGNKFGSKYERPSTIAGGVVLILIGLKILVEHLFF
ncbi:MAG: manganese efflux pump MntP family protein [Eggerthellales bacterium]|nr:manganese efflux pump MntP family protein [Eggerthellales bacterium]